MASSIPFQRNPGISAADQQDVQVSDCASIAELRRRIIETVKDAGHALVTRRFICSEQNCEQDFQVTFGALADRKDEIVIVGYADLKFGRSPVFLRQVLADAFPGVKITLLHDAGEKARHDRAIADAAAAASSVGRVAFGFFSHGAAESAAPAGGQDKKQDQSPTTPGKGKGV